MQEENNSSKNFILSIRDQRRRRLKPPAAQAAWGSKEKVGRGSEEELWQRQDGNARQNAEHNINIILR